DVSANDEIPAARRDPRGVHQVVPVEARPLANLRVWTALTPVRVEVGGDILGKLTKAGLAVARAPRRFERAGAQIGAEHADVEPEEHREHDHAVGIFSGGAAG